jgi:hypothetical protein
VKDSFPPPYRVTVAGTPELPPAAAAAAPVDILLDHTSFTMASTCRLVRFRRVRIHEAAEKAEMAELAELAAAAGRSVRLRNTV